ncbi:MAG: hypothetical protein R2827_02340 [Bdellovibrionales bacterium]
MTAQVGGAIIEVFEFLFLTAFASHFYFISDQGSDGVSFLDRVGRNKSAYINSSLGVVGQILLWSLLLIIPGVIRQVQLGAYANVIFLSPSGEKSSPLKASQKLMEGYVFPSFLVAMALLVVDVLGMSLGAYFSGILGITVFF